MFVCVFVCYEWLNFFSAPSFCWLELLSQEFVKNAVSLAMWRDGSSGGVIRTVTISKEGVEREMVRATQSRSLGSGQPGVSWVCLSYVKRSTHLLEARTFGVSTEAVLMLMRFVVWEPLALFWLTFVCDARRCWETNCRSCMRGGVLNLF